MKSLTRPVSAGRPDSAVARPSGGGRRLRPGPWWSSLLGEWVDEPTQPLPLVDCPAPLSPGGRGGR